jgi:hypothetical protein
MWNVARAAVAGLAIGLMAYASPAAQERRSGGGGPPYDVAAETTIKATVSRLFEIPAGPDRRMTILTVTADGKTLHLILAPPDFMAKNTFAPKAGDTVEVTGVAGLRVNGEPAMLTRQVRSGGRTLTLRDATGRPAWEGL